MTVRDIIRRRLAGQWLSRPGPASAVEVVRQLGAVQAQDYPGALWALSQRTATALTESAIAAEVDAGRILRTHVLRPTWHFVAREDIRWMLALTGPRVAQQMASYNRKFGLTPALFRRSFAIIERTLGAEGASTRAELRRVLENARVEVGDPQRLGHLMMQAELDALVCSGPRRGTEFTYALLDERAPASRKPFDRDEALGELARRYFATRSPATAHDFAWWSGLTVADARRAIQVAGHLRAWRVNEVEYWMDESLELPRTRATAHLLPNYDEYFIGYRDRAAIGGRAGSTGAVTGGSALIGHVAFLDGQLVAAWRRSMSDAGVQVTMTSLARLSMAERGRLAALSGRLSKFLGRPVRLIWE